MTKTSEKDCIAVINNNISYIKGDINEIKNSLESLVITFASKIELSNVARETETRLSFIEKQITENKEKLSGASRVVVPAITGIVCSVLTFLIIEYFQSH